MKFNFNWGSAPDPAAWAHDAPAGPRPLVGRGGDTSPHNPLPRSLRHLDSRPPSKNLANPALLQMCVRLKNNNCEMKSMFLATFMRANVHTSEIKWNKCCNNNNNNKRISVAPLGRNFRSARTIYFIRRLFQVTCASGLTLAVTQCAVVFQYKLSSEKC